MFKKTNKVNIRKRRDSDEDHDNDKEEMNNNANKIAQTSSDYNSTKKEKSKKSKEAKNKNVSLLSFDNADDEEEGHVLKIKKSSRSKRIAKQIKKRSQEEKDAQNNGTTKSVTPAAKQVPINQTHIYQPQKQKKNGPGNLIKEDASKPPLDSQLADLNSGFIPTPSMIHAARKQREMLRKFGSEVISQEETEKYKDKSQSRLVRDDDDDGSSDDGIMEMKGIEKSKNNSFKRLVPNESEEEADSENDEANGDEEVNRWEEEMIKKGINLQTNQSVNASIAFNQQTNSFSSLAYANAYYGNQMQPESSQSTYRHVEAKTDVTFQSITKRLENRSNSLKEQNRSHQTEMNGLLYDTGESEFLSKHLSDVKEISKEYQFYQELRDYIKDLVSCLREHVPLINNLEENAHSLWKSKTDRLMSRRRQDIQDESSNSAPTKNSAIEKNSEYVQRVREREARKTRRRADRQIKQMNSTHYDGLSSDDEETTNDLAKFDTEFKRIQEAADSVFDDVLEDFCDIKCILQRFSDWRKSQNNSYNDAYIALCIPKLLIPFIRLKVVLWNPLLSSTTHFEEEDWYKEISLFALKNFSPDDEDNNSNILDDTKVLSSIIEKILVVKLNRFIQDVWDPLSTQQTARLSQVLKDLMRDYSFMTVENAQCQKLFVSTCKRLQGALDNDIFIPLLPPSSVNSPAHIFLERQTWTCIKLFGNIMFFAGLLSYNALCELAFSALLNRYILLALQTCIINVTCFDKCHKIFHSIPKLWFSRYEDISKHLSLFSRFLVRFAKSIQDSDQYTGSKTMVKQIKTMLLMIGSKKDLQEI